MRPKTLQRRLQIRGVNWFCQVVVQSLRHPAHATFVTYIGRPGDDPNPPRGLARATGTSAAQSGNAADLRHVQIQENESAPLPAPAEPPQHATPVPRPDWLAAKIEEDATH